MCNSSLHNYLTKDLGLKAYKRKRQPLFTKKKQKKKNVKIDFDLQRNTKICLKKYGKTMCLAQKPMYLFYDQNRKNDIVWGSQEDKVPVAKTVKRVRM